MALRRTKREAGLENTLPKRWLMALRRTKEAGLENALPKVVDGSKAH